MGLQLKTAPTQSEILALCTLEKMKANLRISHSFEDDLINDCVYEAYDWLSGENGWLNRTILTATWVMSLPGFWREWSTIDRQGRPTRSWLPTKTIILPKPPLQSVTSVKYLVDGAYVTLDTDQYVTTKYSLFGAVDLADGAAWPTEIDTHPEAVQIEFVAGYGDAAAVLGSHMGLHKAMKLLASDYYRNREDTFTDIRMVEIDRRTINGVARVAGRYRIMNSYA